MHAFPTRRLRIQPKQTAAERFRRQRPVAALYGTCIHQQEGSVFVKACQEILSGNFSERSVRFVFFYMGDKLGIDFKNLLGIRSVKRISKNARRFVFVLYVVIMLHPPWRWTT